ncbi:FUSC family protein [Fluviicola sp.]|uniref:FUSC family protein n=1 Tax=Fluviicola sp. TaxID=1917219 RepID=UPI0031CFEDF7
MFPDKIIREEFRSLFAFKQTTRKWEIPFLASICVGTPLLAGLYFGNLRYGVTACLSGMAILYLPNSGSLSDRMKTILGCSFGFMLSSAFGLIFSFHPLVAAFALGLFAFGVHWIVLAANIPPPKSFFFILIAAMSICQPFDLDEIPLKIGLLGLGTLFTCSLAFCYLLIPYFKRSETTHHQPTTAGISISPDIWEAVVTGIFMLLSLLIGYLFHLKNPYWVPISCAAVMQGASLYHIRQRTFHRILGTFIGLGFCWLILLVAKTPLSVCITVMVLQCIIEILVVRQYALAVIFITPLTVLLAETANPTSDHINTLIFLRFWDISIGSILGAIGGWVLYREKVRHAGMRRLRMIRAGISKKKHQKPRK